MEKSIYAEPREVTNIDDCYFYHTMDIPNHGTVYGEWDLRGRESSYLGNVDSRGKRVLEVGTASGHLCFTMEKMGAKVVAYDLSEEQEWDIVPYAGYDYGEYIAKRKRDTCRLNNGFWFAHRAFNSNAKVVYGTVYEIPDDIGQFDICTFGSILLHLRDPFLALQRILAHVKETVIVTDVPIVLTDEVMFINRLADNRLIRFRPDSEKCDPFETWWVLSPEIVLEFVKILGFIHTRISFHKQLHHGKEIELYTIVGQRKSSPATEKHGHAKRPDSIAAGENDKTVLEERILERIRYHRIIRHLLKRGLRAFKK